MSATTTILGNQPPSDTAILIGNPELDMPAAGWDTLKETLWLPHPYFLRRGEIRDGPGPEGGLFVVQDLRTTSWRAGRPIVEVISQGIATQDGKDYKLEASGSINEDLSMASGAYFAATIWRLGYPRVTKTYVSLTTPDITDHVNVSSLPPDTFGLPATLWGMAWVAADNWVASGWRGESMVPQQLPGSKACLVTQTWLYDPGYIDRDGYAGIITL